MRTHVIPIALVAALAAGCSGSSSLGEGTKPVELFLGAGERQSSLEMDECTTVQLGAYVRFDGDASSVGDYAYRATFASSDPSVVFVGDGTSVSPDGVVYAPGMVVALKPGLATISSSYQTFSATLVVQVEQLRDVRIEPALSDIAEDLPQKFKLVAAYSAERPEQDVSAVGAWSFEPATARASVDTGGSVQANSFRDDQLLTLVSRLPECGRRATRQFRVSQIAGLDLEYEFGADARMPLATSEAVRVYARFAAAGATRQNVSGSAELENVPDDVIAASVVTTEVPDSISDLLNRADIQNDLVLVTALEDAGTAGFDIHVDSGAGLDASTRTWQLVDLDLETVSVDPEEISVRYPDNGRLAAIGHFSDGTARDISRHVTWTSLDTDAVAVAIDADSAGEIGVGNVDRDVEVEAYAENATVTTSDRALIHVYSSASRPLDSSQ
jgi:hypothetical protein